MIQFVNPVRAADLYLNSQFVAGDHVLTVHSILSRQLFGRLWIEIFFFDDQHGEHWFSVNWGDDEITTARKGGLDFKIQ